MTLTEKAVERMTEAPGSNRSTRWWLRQDSYDVVIEAPAQRLYGMVADMPRMGEWSPECLRVEWLEGATGPPVRGRSPLCSPVGRCHWKRSIAYRRLDSNS